MIYQDPCAYNTPSSSHIHNSAIPGAARIVPTYILPVQIAYLSPKRETSKIEGGKQECKRDYIFTASTLQRPSNPTLQCTPRIMTYMTFIVAHASVMLLSPDRNQLMAFRSLRWLFGLVPRSKPCLPRP